jgi:hypothetical protein
MSGSDAGRSLESDPMNRLGIVVRTWNDAPIPRRDSDGYVNATAVCQANGKRWGNYIRTESAKAYVHALSEYKGLPADQVAQP